MSDNDNRSMSKPVEAAVGVAASIYIISTLAGVIPLGVTIWLVFKFLNMIHEIGTILAPLTN